MIKISQHYYGILVTEVNASRHASQGVLLFVTYYLNAYYSREQSMTTFSLVLITKETGGKAVDLYLEVARVECQQTVILSEILCDFSVSLGKGLKNTLKQAMTRLSKCLPVHNSWSSLDLNNI